MYVKCIAERSSPIIHNLHCLLDDIVQLWHNDPHKNTVPVETAHTTLAKIRRHTTIQPPCVLYPASGFDALTALKLHPDMRAVLKISKEPYGTPPEILENLIFFRNDIHNEYYHNALTPTRRMDLIGTPFELEDKLAQYHLNGSYELIKLAVFLDIYPVYIETTTPAPQTTITTVKLENRHGKEFWVWHITTDLEQANTYLQEEIRTRQPQTVLIKSAFKLQLTPGFYDNILEPARQQNMQLILDKSWEGSDYPIWNNHTPPNKIPLENNEHFGYCQGHFGDMLTHGYGAQLRPRPTIDDTPPTPRHSIPVGGGR